MLKVIIKEIPTRYVAKYGSDKVFQSWATTEHGAGIMSEIDELAVALDEKSMKKYAKLAKHFTIKSEEDAQDFACEILLQMNSGWFGGGSL